MTNETREEKNMPEEIKKKTDNSTLIITFLAGFKQVSQNSFVVKAADVLNIPALKVNGGKIEYSEYLDDVKTLRKVYIENEEFASEITEEQISDQAVARLITNKITAELARKYDVQVSTEDVEKAKEELLANFDDQEKADEELMSIYGWTMEKYINKVIKPVLLEQNLAKFLKENSNKVDEKYLSEEVSARHILFQFEGEESNDDLKARAQEVLDRIKNGEDFSILATEFGTDATRNNGGELGYIARGITVPEFENIIFSVAPGTLIDEPVKTEFGYHIIEVLDKRDTVDFESYLTDQIKSADVKILININNPLEDYLNSLE